MQDTPQQVQDNSAAHTEPAAQQQEQKEGLFKTIFGKLIGK